VLAASKCNVSLDHFLHADDSLLLLIVAEMWCCYAA